MERGIGPAAGSMMGERRVADPILEVKNLKKCFPIRTGFFRRGLSQFKAVDDVSFSIHRGEVLGLVGESGCGKSTTARAAIRLIEPTSGEISFLGEDLLALKGRALRRRRQKIQMVFQDPYSSLNPRKTIAENVGEVLTVHKLVSSSVERDDRVVEALSRVGLMADVLGRYPHQFSGGQQQRICIARALICQPELIICDEAVSALDVSVQAQILNLLLDLRQDLGLSFLFISHDLSVVRYLCDQMVVMHHGRIVERGSAAELFANPQQEYTQRLLSAIPKVFA